MKQIGTLALSTLAVWALAAAPAGATGSYPGETLSLAQSGPAVAGQETTFIATGQQTDVNDYPGGFSLEVFAKNTNTDPTCSPSYPGEQQASLTDPYEQWIVVGLWQGPGTTFSVPFKYNFPRTGQVILCAYSAYITDTAAAATLVANITSPGGTGPTGPGPTPPSTHHKPVNVHRPSIKRHGKALACGRGSWTGARSYAYAWLVNGHLKRGARKQRLAITKALKGRRVACRVTAANSVGRTTASSGSLRVR